MNGRSWRGSGAPARTSARLSGYLASASLLGLLVDTVSPEPLLLRRRASAFCKAALKKSTSSVFSASRRFKSLLACAARAPETSPLSPSLAHQPPRPLIQHRAITPANRTPATTTASANRGMFIASFQTVVPSCKSQVPGSSLPVTSEVSIQSLIYQEL
jgi:hypothetical protein